MATDRILARNLRRGHVLAVTGERVTWRTTGGKGVGLELLGKDGIERATTYADDAMVTIELEAEDARPAR